MRCLVLPLILSFSFAPGVAAQDWLAQGFVGGPGPSPLEAPPSLGNLPSGAGIGPDQAAAIARAQTGGRVLDAQQLPGGGTSAFAVRLLLDAGRVRTVVVDGQSGRLR
ncbi:MAG: PepSY domain-containing protein [Gammaproteobacteria bacterium]